MVSIKEILQGLSTQAKTVCQTVYTQERPTATSGGLTSFIVVSLPTSFQEEIHGAKLSWWTHTVVQFSIYVKDKATAANPNQMNIPSSDTITQGIMDMIPFTIEGSTNTYNVVNPEIVYTGVSDGNGFHVTLIQATLNTL